MAFIVTDFNEYKSYGNCLNERFIFHLAILKGVARMGKYFSVSIEALAPKQPCIVRLYGNAYQHLRPNSLSGTRM